MKMPYKLKQWLVDKLLHSDHFVSDWKRMFHEKSIQVSDLRSNNYCMNQLNHVLRELTHLQRVLAKKNRRLKMLEAFWRQKKRRSSQVHHASIHSDPEMIAAGVMANELANFMKMRGIEAFGPIELRS